MSIQYSSILTSARRQALLVAIENHLQTWAEAWFTSGQAAIEVLPGIFNQHLFKPAEQVPPADSTLFNCGDYLLICEDEKMLNLAALAMDVAAQNQADNTLLNQVQQQMLIQLSQGLQAIGQIESSADDNVDTFACALKVDFVLAGCRLSLLFSGHYLHRFNKSQHSDNQQKLMPLLLKSMVAQQSVGLELVMQSQPVTVAQLIGLEVGNVIALNQLIKDPLVLQAAKGQTQLKGFLVKKAQQKAVFITGISK